MLHQIVWPLGEARTLVERVEELAVPVVVDVPDEDEFDVSLAQQAVDAAEVGGEATELLGVLLGTHPAATAPVLVADAPERHVVGLLAAVFRPAVREFGVAVVVAVLEPVSCLARRPAAEVGREVRFGVEQITDLHELLRAELVWLFGDILSPPRPEGVAAGRSLLERAEPVHPVIVVGESPDHPGAVDAGLSDECPGIFDAKQSGEVVLPVECAHRRLATVTLVVGLVFRDSGDGPHREPEPELVVGQETLVVFALDVIPVGDAVVRDADLQVGSPAVALEGQCRLGGPMARVRDFPVAEFVRLLDRLGSLLKKVELGRKTAVLRPVSVGRRIEYAMSVTFED